MQGIEKLSWTGSSYAIETCSTQGQNPQLTIASLPDILCERESGDRQLSFNGTTSFQAWLKLSNHELRAVHGALGLDPKGFGQAFYKFTDENQTFIIPIGVAMCSLFRPFPGMSRFLLSPQGLENLLLPSENISKPTIQFYGGARGNTGIQPDKAEGILNSLSWMYCFPSARRAWNSVLEHARQGRLDMALPIGSFSFSGRGLPVGDEILITELQVKLLETIEEPFPAFSAHTKVIEFQRILHSERRMTGGSKKDSDLPSHPTGEGYGLTDDEWLVLQPQLERPSQIPRQFSLRIVIDGILLKLSQGIPWSEVPDLQFNPALLPRTYSRMQKDGRWETLMSCLRQRSAC